MNTKVIIFGAGGHSRVIADIIRLSGDIVAGFLDDNVRGEGVLGKTGDAHKFSDCQFVVGIGNNSVRERLMQENPGLTWYTAIHPSAVVAQSAKIGEGAVIAANAVVGVDCHIGRGVIINTCATIDHDGFAGDFSHLAQGVHTGGAVNIGKGVWIGVGTSVVNGIKISDYSVVEAGISVKNDVE